ncbi:facilitated trehalose transporter Tret1-like [Ceratina calcarata]|uniref:Facilitated trehalose transporter Tret1-like n=1 Tax=Ceratina calcarata TaxID=156304 RepID=A0AAJ7J836_9HYME|nr:facilitated trehalose transporter Tret1-like [Ceratina calcarata]
MTTTAPRNDRWNFFVLVQKLNPYFGAFVASLGGFALGISLAWNSKASKMFRDHLDATGTEIGLIGGILNAGICVGAILVPFIAERFSRARILFWTMPPLVITWMYIMGNRSEQVVILMTGRFICGICGGIYSVLTPIYVAEITRKEVRGRHLAYFQVLINCGIMYAFSVAHAIEETVWWYSKVCGFACFLLVPQVMLPNSPFHYLFRNDETNAVVSLEWFRDTNDVQHELNELKQLVHTTRSRKINMKLLKNRRVLRSIVTCIGVMLGQNLCGANMMIFHALTLFDITGSGELTGSEQTMVIGAVQILVSFLAASLVDVLGRRILLTVSCLLMGVFLILLGWFFSVRDADPEYDDIYFWMSPTWITLMFASYNLGLGPISWSILGDTLPEELKNLVASAAVALGWLVSLLASLSFEEMVVMLGATKVMWGSAAICWLIALFCAIVVKDNTGKSLLEIQKEFRIEADTVVET